MNGGELPEEAPLSMGQKVALSELAAMLIIWSAGHSGEIGRPLARGGQKASQFKKKDHRYLAYLIKQAAAAGLGSNPRAHALFAHELDYFSGLPRRMGLEGDSEDQ